MSTRPRSWPGKSNEQGLLDCRAAALRRRHTPHGQRIAAPRRRDSSRQGLRAEPRRAGAPVAYLTGTREFWSLPLAVTPQVLVPRPDTETLVEAALELMPRDRACAVVDLGTGSGAIALALARERPLARVVGTDVSQEALEVA